MAALTTTHPQFNRIAPHLPVGTATIIRKFAAQLFGEAGDVLKVCTLGRGDKITAGCFVQCAALDDVADHVLSLEVTNGTTTKTIIHESTVGQAGGLVRPTLAPASEDGVNYVVPDTGYWVQAICDTAAATEAAGDIVIGVEITGHRDNELTE
jgi:hypothetical protein